MTPVSTRHSPRQFPLRPYIHSGILQEKGRFLEPRPPLGQNASLRAGIEKETGGLTLIYTLHSPPAIPFAPLQHLRRYCPT
jgi:hypothetical protein